MIRIDHILGFERAFWVPDALPGAYVAMPRDAMLAVVRIEAARAGAVVVGEDLGHVPEGLTETLAAGGILGCAVAQFEPDLSPEDWPEAALASFGTHDLPTWEGWRGARDIAAREERVGLTTGDEARAGRADEVARFVRTLERGPGGDEDAGGALGRRHARLSRGDALAARRGAGRGRAERSRPAEPARDGGRISELAAAAAGPGGRSRDRPGA